MNNVREENGRLICTNNMGKMGVCGTIVGMQYTDKKRSVTLYNVRSKVFVREQKTKDCSLIVTKELTSYELNARRLKRHKNTTVIEFSGSPITDLSEDENDGEATIASNLAEKKSIKRSSIDNVQPSTSDMGKKYGVPVHVVEIGYDSTAQCTIQ